MKKTNRFIAMAAALTLTASSMIPMFAFADGETPSGQIVISNSTSDDGVHSYAAYQIFSGVYDEGTGGLKNIAWAIPDKRTENSAEVSIYTDLVAIGMKKSDNSAFTSVDEVVEALSAITTDDADLTKKFAAVVAKYVDATKAKTATSGTISGLADGYYLVEDSANPTAGTSGNNSGAMTRYILTVVNGSTTTVTSKSSAPTVIKKVKEEDLAGDETKETTAFAGSNAYDLGDGYNDIADYDIGDEVPFKDYGTLPSTYDDYTQYFYEFEDWLDKGKFGTPENVKVCIDGKEVTDKVTITDTFETDGKIKYTFSDLKQIDKDDEGNDLTVTKDSIITVEYTAELQTTADLGTAGQASSVKLNYSSNPNESTVTQKGSTPVDGVVVFTYGIDIKKVDDKENSLAGAYFAVYKKVGEKKYYVKTDTDGKVTGYTETAPVKTDNAWGNTTNGVFLSTTSGNIIIEGLDHGTYYITELEAPEHYSKLAADEAVTITATMATDRQAWTFNSAGDTNKTALTAFAIDKAVETTLDSDTGKGTVKIVNTKTSSLPSTGGIGTTLFYIGGGCMVGIAGILLITKKRTKNANN